MHLSQALSQIEDIRRHIARTEKCRGLRAASVAASGVLACIVAWAQSQLIPAPLDYPGPYVALWLATAAIGFAIPASRLVARYYRTDSELVRQVTRLALELLAPSLVAGALLTLAVYRASPESLWMLPGLWSIVFSLGMFAVSRLFPRATLLVGCYYLLAGLICLLYFRHDLALSPWAMVITFGVGQLLAAAVLYLEWERGDD